MAGRSCMCVKRKRQAAGVGDCRALPCGAVTLYTVGQRGNEFLLSSQIRHVCNLHGASAGTLRMLKANRLDERGGKPESA